MEALRPNTKRAQNAMILVWIAMALDIAALISHGMQYSLLKTVANGGTVTQDAATANDTRENIISFLILGVTIISAVTFIQWFRRAYFNLHQKVTDLEHPENQAAICWFIPFVNFARPYKIMNELYVRTAQLLKQSNESEQRLSEKLLPTWWTLWILNGIVGQVAYRIANNAKEIDELINGTIASMATNLVGIPVAIITVKVIKDYARIEPILADGLDLGTSEALDSAPIIK